MRAWRTHKHLPIIGGFSLGFRGLEQRLKVFDTPLQPDSFEVIHQAWGQDLWVSIRLPSLIFLVIFFFSEPSLVKDVPVEGV